MLAELENPINTQLQLYSVLVRGTTAEYVAQLSSADRNSALVCTPACSGGETCSAAQAQCVPPSEVAGSVDDYVDFVPNPTPPEGYTFAMRGCAYDNAGKTELTSEPTELVIQSPDVTVEGLVFHGSYAEDIAGVWRGGGSVSATEMRLGRTPFGPATGSYTARLMPPGEIPPGLPEPPD